MSSTVRLALMAIALGAGAALAAGEFSSDSIIRLQAKGIGFGEDRAISISPEARNALLPCVKGLKGNRQERVVLAFKANPKDLESATALYTYMQLLGVNRQQMRLASQDGGRLGLKEGELTLLCVPEGQPLPQF